MNVFQKLLAGAVDYAGLFPPAGLTMPETVANYARYRCDPAKAMLGRLVVPSGRLAEVRASVDRLESDLIATDASPWQLSALVPASPANDYEDFHQALNTIINFNQLNRSGECTPLLVDSIEVKVNTQNDLQHLAENVPAQLDCYFEIDCQSEPNALIETLARVSSSAVMPVRNVGGNAVASTEPHRTQGGRLFGKIRTGSVVANQIPGIDRVARFIAACARDYVPFKATAGLHHPIRNEYRLTYEPNSDCGTMHGFLNMFVATLCAFEYQLNELEIAQILNDREAHNFHFEDDRIQWHHLTIGLDRIDTLRIESIQSFGSCSFVEPTTELCELYQCQLS
jgi:hypothetical protein